MAGNPRKKQFRHTRVCKIADDAGDPVISLRELIGQFFLDSREQTHISMRQEE
jgi:hypothetical protein